MKSPKSVVYRAYGCTYGSEALVWLRTLGKARKSAKTRVFPLYGTPLGGPLWGGVHPPSPTLHDQHEFPIYGGAPPLPRAIGLVGPIEGGYLDIEGFHVFSHFFELFEALKR